MARELNLYLNIRRPLVSLSENSFAGVSSKPVYCHLPLNEPAHQVVGHQVDGIGPQAIFPANRLTRAILPGSSKSPNPDNSPSRRPTR